MIDVSSTVKSGVGTSMFSRTGASTISANRVFKSKFNTLDEYISAQTSRVPRGMHQLAEEEDEKDGKFPRIEESEDGPMIVIPGLAKEIKRLDLNYSQV